MKCINGQGHITKMAAMALAINSKNILKYSSPEPEGLSVILKLSMKHQAMEL